MDPKETWQLWSMVGIWWHVHVQIQTIFATLSLRVVLPILGAKRTLGKFRECIMNDSLSTSALLYGILVYKPACWVSFWNKRRYTYTVTWILGKEPYIWNKICSQKHTPEIVYLLLPPLWSDQFTPSFHPTENNCCLWTWTYPKPIQNSPKYIW